MKIWVGNILGSFIISSPCAAVLSERIRPEKACFLTELATTEPSAPTAVWRRPSPTRTCSSVPCLSVW
eukprot:4626462-Pyramimonas_sp.AAC.1